MGLSNQDVVGEFSVWQIWWTGAQQATWINIKAIVLGIAADNDTSSNQVCICVVPQLPQEIIALDPGRSATW